MQFPPPKVPTTIGAAHNDGPKDKTDAVISPRMTQRLTRTPPREIIRERELYHQRDTRSSTQLGLCVSALAYIRSVARRKDGQTPASRRPVYRETLAGRERRWTNPQSAHPPKTHVRGRFQVIGTAHAEPQSLYAPETSDFEERNSTDGTRSIVAK